MLEMLNLQTRLSTRSVTRTVNMIRCALNNPTDINTNITSESSLKDTQVVDTVLTLWSYLGNLGIFWKPTDPILKLVFLSVLFRLPRRRVTGWWPPFK